MQRGSKDYPLSEYNNCETDFSCRVRCMMLIIENNKCEAQYVNIVQECKRERERENSDCLLRMKKVMASESTIRDEAEE